MDHTSVFRQQAAAGQQQHNHQQHLLAFRVMRLRRPQLLPDAGVRLAPEHLDANGGGGVSGALGALGRVAQASGGGVDGAVVSGRADGGAEQYVAAEASCVANGEIAIPSSFGNIYLGENFRAYVSVVNPCQDGGANGGRSAAALGSPRVGSTAGIPQTGTTGSPAGFDDARLESPSGGISSVSPGGLTSSMGAMNAASTGASQSMMAASNVCLKAELHTERNRVLLYDSAQSPLAKIDPGCSTGFVVDQDIKDPGTHTLVCSVTYTDSYGERRYMPQYFKFQVTNPLSVRTKVRSCQAYQQAERESLVFLEVSVENVSKEPMLLESVDFDTAPNIRREIIGAPVAADARGDPVQPNDLLSSLDSTPGGGDGSGNVVFLSVGGSRHFLFRLQRYEDTPGKGAGSSILGRVELRWRRGMGERGRLQTQQISSGQQQQRDIDIMMTVPYPEPVLDSPFTVRLAARCDPHGSFDLDGTRSRSLAITLSEEDAAENKYMLYGEQVVPIGSLSADAAKTVSLRLVAMVPGVLRITGLLIVDTDVTAGDSKTNVVGRVSPIEVFVKAPS